jgi:hypothetical protein
MSKTITVRFMSVSFVDVRLKPDATAVVRDEACRVVAVAEADWRQV